MCYLESITTLHTLPESLTEWIPEAGERRRMSRIVKMGICAALQCLGGREELAHMDAILTASGWGCLSDSERFLRTSCENQEQLLNPTPFIQSTFNTLGAHLARMGANHSYNTTYVHRGRSFESALLDAQFRLMDGDAQRVLVGAYDEQTDTQHHLMERMGCWRRGAHDGEGCTFALLTRSRSAQCHILLKQIDFPTQPLTATEGLSLYASTASAHWLCAEADEPTYPTRSAELMTRATTLLGPQTPEVVIYNEYLGEDPTVIVLQWIA